MNEDLKNRLLFILHRGLVEARLLAKGSYGEQVFDLTDALEPIPGYIEKYRDEYIEMIRFNLRTYREKYPSSSFDYLRYLDTDPPPEAF